jgi:mannose-6-phosphate isomerase-like protein (cupin superfamily)
VNCFKEIDAIAGFAADKMKKNNIFTTERMFCDVYCFEPGQAQDAHSHVGSDKVYFVLDGRGTVRVGDAEQDVGPGSAVLAPAGEPHGVANPGPARLRVLVFMAPPP